MLQLAGLPVTQVAGSTPLYGATFHTYPATQLTFTTVLTIGVLGMVAAYGDDITIGQIAETETK